MQKTNILRQNLLLPSHRPIFAESRRPVAHKKVHTASKPCFYFSHRPVTLGAEDLDDVELRVLVDLAKEFHPALLQQHAHQKDGQRAQAPHAHGRPRKHRPDKRVHLGSTRGAGGMETAVKGTCILRGHQRRYTLHRRMRWGGGSVLVLRINCRLDGGGQPICNDGGPVLPRAGNTCRRRYRK